jgi:signal transduction histidine kinase
VLALRHIGTQIVNGSGARFHLTASGKRRSTPPEMQAQLLLMAQEAIRNAVHHGRAKQILVHVEYSGPDGLRIRVHDDGRGFDPRESSDKIGHWGLTTMRERAKEIGAELIISAAPGHGATIEIVVRRYPGPDSHTTS